MKLSKLMLIIIFCLALTTWGYGAVHFYIFGKANFNNALDTGYEAGTNDFSTQAAYSTYGAGCGLITGSRIFLGLEIHYNLNGTATLTDPSDNDTVNIDTYKYASGFLTLGINIVQSTRFKLYIQGGGGIGYGIKIETKTYTSSLGFETIIEPPKNKTPIIGFGGLGLEVHFSRVIGVMAQGRYQYLASDDAQPAIVAMGGLVFSF